MTVARKLIFLATQARMRHHAFLEELSATPLEDLQFDEMESFEHSKCKPLSIPLVVHAPDRKILGFRVCSMPAKGPLAQIALRKYGPRKDERKAALVGLFKELSPLIYPQAQMLSDQKPMYPYWLKEALPKVKHRTVKGRRGCVVGQGELKKIGFDPLFSLNHSCAMLRANVNRLFRRTWCTTKKPERLSDHIALYVDYHNRFLTPQSTEAA